MEIDEPIICILEVNENIRRVESGQALTRSLKILNTNCHFKEKYDVIDKIMHPDEDRKAKQKKYMREYYQRS